MLSLVFQDFCSDALKMEVLSESSAVRKHHRPYSASRTAFASMTPAAIENIESKGMLSAKSLLSRQLNQAAMYHASALRAAANLCGSDKHVKCGNAELVESGYLCLGRGGWDFQMSTSWDQRSTSWGGASCA